MAKTEAFVTKMNKSQWLLVSRLQIQGDSHLKPRSKTTMRPLHKAVPDTIIRDDSLTDFLKENAVTSLPPIDLINRFRFLGVEKQKRHFRQERREESRRVRCNLLTKRLPLRYEVKDVLETGNLMRKSASPETVRSVTRSALKPLSKAQLEGSHRDMYPQELLLRNFIPHSLDPIVTVRSHMQHY